MAEWLAYRLTYLIIRVRIPVVSLIPVDNHVRVDQSRLLMPTKPFVLTNSMKNYRRAADYRFKVIVLS